MRTLSYGMNVSLDGFIAAPGDDLSWGVPSDELFGWWSDRIATTGTALYGRRLWQTMNAYWPTADQDPDASPADVQFAQRWRAMSKVVFSSTLTEVEGNARLVSGDAIAEISRLKEQDGPPMEIGGATLAGHAVRAGLVDEFVVATVPVILGGGTPFLSVLERWVTLTLSEVRTFRGGVVLTRYETVR